MYSEDLEYRSQLIRTTDYCLNVVKEQNKWKRASRMFC